MKSVEELIKMIKRGEGNEIKFKESKDKLNREVTEHVTEYVSRDVTEKELLEFCKTPKATPEIMEFLNLNNREHVRTNIIKPLLESGKLRMTIPEKPKSTKQKYITGYL